MSVKRGVVSSRHRFVIDVLSFNNLYDDQLTSSDLYPIASSGLYFVEIELDTTRLTPGDTEVVIGNHDENANNNSQWMVVKRNDGSLRFNYQRNVFIEHDDFDLDFPNDKVVIRAVWADAGVELYVNGILRSAPQSVLRPTAPSTPVLVAGRNGVQMANFDCYKININDEHVWDFTSETGFVTTSDSGRVMTGSTTNAGLETYWNEFVRIKV